MNIPQSDESAYLVPNKTEALVQAAQSGNQEAMGQLFSAYQDMVYAVALRVVRQPNRAEELVQKVFMRAMSRIHQLEEPRAFAGWLRTTTTRMAINEIKRNRNGVVFTDMDSTESGMMEKQTVGSMPDASLILEQLELRDKVQQVVGDLDDLSAEVLKLFYVHGKSLIYISDQLEVPIGTVKRRLFTARRRVQQAFNGSITDYFDT